MEKELMLLALRGRPAGSSTERDRSESTRVPLRPGRRLCVSKSEQYRRLAQACLEIARKAEDEGVRASLVHIAQVWFRLAEECVNEGDE
jgi:hypothetical protein